MLLDKHFCEFIQLIIQMSGELISSLKNGELANSGILTHLTQLIRESYENKSDLKGLNNIQVFSYYLRKNKFAFKEFLGEAELAQKVNKQHEYLPYIKAINQLKTKLAKTDNSRVYQRPDVVQEHQALKLAGVGIGQTNAYHLNKVIKTLAAEHQAKSIRFWGKILGYRDYWVIQGSSNKAYLSDLPQNGQRYGNGVNTYSYWVTNSILGEWSQLPLVTPQQVGGSRTFKYIFTGDLQKDINRGSSFNGKQKHLLKCIIARITHSCELAPKGLYKPTEQNPNIIDFEQEFKLPEIGQLNSLEAWAHLNSNILVQGRCSYYIDPKLSEQQKEALNTELAQKDPILQRLKGINDDKPCEALGFTTNWSVSIAGQTVPVNQIGKQQGTSVIYGVVCLRNLVWPGGVTVGYRGGWTNIYVGYGHRLSLHYNAIRQLKQLQIQGEQRTQRPEPNPSKAPVPVVQQKKDEIPPE